MIYKVKYQGGYPTWDTPKSVEISIKDDKLMIQESGFATLNRIILIPKNDIVDISFEKMSTRSAGKTVGGAIVGGVLTGGIGFLVGGAIGASKKNKSELYIAYKYNNRELVLSIEAGSNVNKIYSMINSLFAIAEPAPTIAKPTNALDYKTAEPSIEEITNSAHISNETKPEGNIGCAIVFIIIVIAFLIFLMNQCE